MAINTIRFSGLASGLDTESIVKSMVAPYKLKADSKKQQQTMMEWRKDAWKDMNSKLFTFYDKQVNKMRMESTFNKSKVTSSNDSVVQLDPNATLPSGTHDLKIDQLATGTRIQTQGVNGVGATGATTLAELGITADTTLNITANGKPVVPAIELTKDMTIDQLVNKLKTAAPDYSVSFDKGMGAFFISSKNTGSNQAINITGDYDVLHNLGLAGEKNLPKGTDINFETSPGSGISGKIDTVPTAEGKYLIKDSSDPSKEIGYVDEKGDSYIYTDPNDKNTGVKAVVSKNLTIDGTKAQDAKVTYNGVTSEFQSNSISINGLSMNLKGTGSTTLVSTKDTESTFNAIKEFVDEYNKLIDDMNKKVAAPSIRDYKPLTDDQKKDMKDADIEAWEKKIKDSIFRNDDAMKQVTSKMREVMGSVVKDSKDASTGKTLASIGITTGSWKDYGKLTIDETKLKKALADDPETVTKLFSANSDAELLYKAEKTNTIEWKDLDSSEKKKYQDQVGIADRLYSSLTEMTMSSQLRSKYSFYNDKALTKDIGETKSDYAKLVDRMDSMESMYYKKFTAMEKTMQSLNSQSSWLTQQLGGM